MCLRYVCARKIGSVTLMPILGLLNEVDQDHFVVGTYVTKGITAYVRDSECVYD